MGKVYEFSEIAGNRIPRASDFARAKAIVLNELGEVARNGEIYGAKVFGSVANGIPNERSDFDLLIITEHDGVLRSLKQIFESVRDETNVCVEPLVIDKDFAVQGLHSIEDLFLDHIRGIPNEGNVAGLDPMEIMQSFGLPATIVHEQYLAQKLRRLREGLFTYSHTDRIRVLQRALEAPINVGRRTLQVLSGKGEDVLHDDRKPTVVRTFRDVFKDTPLITGFERLLSNDSFYTDYLQDTLQGNVSEQEYEAKVNLLASECIPQAITWTADLSRIFINRLEGNLRDSEGNRATSSNRERYP